MARPNVAINWGNEKKSMLESIPSFASASEFNEEKRL